MPMPPLKQLALAGALALAATLAGCAGMAQFSADVSSYGDWPSARQRGSYAFERLPSQQLRAESQQLLEDAASAALAQAGFRPSPAGAEPDLVVQVGARISRAERSPWDDPLWWRGGFGTWRGGGWRGPHWTGPYWATPLRYDSPRYEREVALLLRDRATGKPLYEAHASAEGYQRGVAAALRPLFEAAMKDFPATGPNPRSVTVPLSGG